MTEGQADKRPPRQRFSKCVTILVSWGKSVGKN